jgi:hypothetical protein
MKERRATWPNQGELADPAPDGATWPCGHPRTERNTQRVGNAGTRCRICRRKITRDFLRNRRIYGD